MANGFHRGRTRHSTGRARCCEVDWPTRPVVGYVGRPVRELALNVDEGLGRRAGLERALRDAIRGGRLSAGSRLPSTRILGADLGYSRATVVSVYEQLTAEGYLASRQGLGTVVAAVRQPSTEQSTPGRFQTRFKSDFRPGEPDNSMFPRDSWLRSIRHVLSSATDEILGYPDPRGPHQLRVALAEYLARSRAVEVTPDAVSTFAGIAAAIGFLGETFKARGITQVAVEDPTLFIVRDILRIVGVEPVPIPVDSQGLVVDALEASSLQVVFVTPAHQYPMGMTMSAERRTSLVAWAKRTGGVIVEDDYDGEFRYDRRPLGALQGLDPEHVVYAGTASKSLVPGLRLAWLVAPPALRAELQEIKHARGSSSVLEQLTLAHFIERGELDRQLRSVRKIYRDRQATLVAALKSEVAGLAIQSYAAGLHLVGLLPDDVDEQELVRAAGDDGIGLMGLAAHRMGTDGPPGLVLGYSRPAGHQFESALDHLVRFLQSHVGCLPDRLHSQA